jgi:hypothetical protein
MLRLPSEAGLRPPLSSGLHFLKMPFEPVQDQLAVPARIRAIRRDGGLWYESLQGSVWMGMEWS